MPTEIELREITSTKRGQFHVLLIREKDFCSLQVSCIILHLLLWKSHNQIQFFFFNTSLVDVFFPSIPIPTVGINSNVLQCQLMIEIVIGTNPYACIDIIFFFFLEMRWSDSIKLCKLDESSSVYPVASLFLSFRPRSPLTARLCFWSCPLTESLEQAKFNWFLGVVHLCTFRRP